ncbi:hypothetical protein JQC92_09585 [Shewanella sp. 202IG2-18]|uniref:hypothetical protein n=1 Tax=Parashewanella hymeniacidonis TaxID=2807618 RepID=UPI0019603C87|nr:hypothetical protein [Parashewanella hymeniacidonis]MBM7072278.1 hypothetical protein [Parashewanella hymeniacidonis]
MATSKINTALTDSTPASIPPSSQRNFWRKALDYIKPNRWKLPAHAADRGRQLMAVTVFSAKDAQEAQTQHGMVNHTNMHHSAGMNMGHGVSIASPHSSNMSQSHMAMPHSETMNTTAAHTHSPHMPMGGMHTMPMTGGVLTATATIGGALSVGAGVISVANAYQLGKHWDQMSVPERTGETLKLTGTVALAGVGATIIGGLATGSAMSVMPVVAAAGPAGLGAIAAGNVIIASYHGYKATRAGVDLKAISKHEAHMQQTHNKTEVGETLVSRAKGKLRSDIKTRLFKIGVLALTTVGLVLGAALIAGALATPVGWVAAGIVAAGFIAGVSLTVGLFIYRKYKAKQEGNDAEITKKIQFAQQTKDQVQQRLDYELKVGELRSIQQEIDRQRGADKLQLKRRREWFVTNLDLFKLNEDTARNTLYTSAESITLKVLELNEDYLIAATKALISETDEH